MRDIRYVVQKVFSFGIYIQSTHTNKIAALLKAESDALEEKREDCKVYVVKYEDNRHISSVECVAEFEAATGATLFKTN